MAMAKKLWGLSGMIFLSLASLVSAPMAWAQEAGKSNADVEAEFKKAAAAELAMNEARWLTLQYGLYDGKTLAADEGLTSKMLTMLASIRSDSACEDVKDVSVASRMRTSTQIGIDLAPGTKTLPVEIESMIDIYHASITIQYDTDAHPKKVYLFFDRMLYVPKLIELAKLAKEVTDAHEEYDATESGVLDGIAVTIAPGGCGSPILWRFAFSKVDGSKDDILTTTYTYITVREAVYEKDDKDKAWVITRAGTRTVSVAKDGTTTESGPKPW